jgi:hypothetical protein
MSVQVTHVGAGGGQAVSSPEQFWASHRRQMIHITKGVRKAELEGYYSLGAWEFQLRGSPDLVLITLRLMESENDTKRKSMSSFEWSAQEPEKLKGPLALPEEDQRKFPFVFEDMATTKKIRDRYEARDSLAWASSNCDSAIDELRRTLRIGVDKYTQALSLLPEKAAMIRAQITHYEGLLATLPTPEHVP